MKKYTIIVVCLILGLVVLDGCNSGSSPVGVASSSRYTLNCVFIQNPNREITSDYSSIALKLEKDSTEFRTATVSFNTIPLAYSALSDVDDSVYTYSIGPIGYIDSGSYFLSITDSSTYTTTVPTVIIDSISFDNPPDTTVPNTNGTTIEYNWFAAANIEGYVLAVVKDDDKYTGNGFSSYIQSQSTSVNVPPDAFRVNQFNALDTGWYSIYIYGYNGSPDSALSSKLLPVPLPSQLSDNIAQTKLTGNFGTIVVASLTHLHVVSQ